MFERIKPTVVIHLAATVGGLFANMSDKVKFFEDNIAINNNVIKSSYQVGVARLVCVLSTCIYPDRVDKYPIEEHSLHEGPPHQSNEGYAYAKRMCEVQCRLYNDQCGTDYICVVPTNLYGPNDSYTEATSHVVAALIRRAHEISKAGGTELSVWGSGKPLRQFCYTPDLALLLSWVAIRKPINGLKCKDDFSLIALVPEKENTIAELAQHVAKEMQIEKLAFDDSKADGQLRKTLSNQTLNKFFKNFEFTTL